jgi:hypothetical protein
MWVPGWLEGPLARIGWRGGVAMVRRISGGKIQITSPRPQERLDDRQENARGRVSYKVRGTLKKLPTAHQIWLLTEDEIDRKFWPQTSDPVQFNPTTGEWHGRISYKRPNRSSVKIFAVVAPPTSQQLFRYYGKVGEKTKNWEPLDEIPPECTNQTYVQGER